MGLLMKKMCLIIFSLTGSNAATAQVLTSLDKVGISHLANIKETKLSGGEKQCLGIARAIYKNAKIIFADKPTVSLDAHKRKFYDFSAKRRVIWSEGSPGPGLTLARSA